MNEAFNIRLKTIIASDMPDGIHGFVSEIESNNYVIFINQNMSKDKQTKTFLHECLHIWRNDFYSGKSVQQIEAETHYELSKLMAET